MGSKSDAEDADQQIDNNMTALATMFQEVKVRMLQWTVL